MIKTKGNKTIKNVVKRVTNSEKEDKKIVKKGRKRQEGKISFELDERDLVDLSIDELPEKKRKKVLADQRSVLNSRIKKKKVVRDRLYHSSIRKRTVKRNYKKKMELREKRAKKAKQNKRLLEVYLREGGNIKDEKAKKLMGLISKANRTQKHIYDKEYEKIKDTTLPIGSGEVPTLLDYGVTFQEARFITEYIKDYDEVRAATAAKLIMPAMKKTEKEEIINDIVKNPNVASALEAVVQDQIQRTLITSDRTLSQIAKMAFNDPADMFKDDGSGSLKDIKNMPKAVRACISEITHKTLYDGRGQDRQVIGFTTKIKMHDSLKALQVLLKDIRDKADKRHNKFNQFNFYGPSNFNLQDRIKDLSSSELDVLLKLANQGTEVNMKELPAPENIQIEDPLGDVVQMAMKEEGGIPTFGIDALKEIEQCNLQK